MGRIEEKVRDEVRRTKINRAVVGALAVAGGLAAAAVAPNVVGVLGKILNAQLNKIRSVLSLDLSGTAT